MNITEFFHRYHIPTYHSREIGMWKADASIINSSGGLHIMAHQLVMVVKGRLLIEMPQMSVPLVAGDFAEFRGLDILQYREASDDLEAWCYMMSEDCFMEIFKQHSPVDTAFVEYITKHKAIHLTERNIVTFLALYRTIEDTLLLKDHPLGESILKMKTKLIYMELQTAFSTLMQNELIDTSNMTRKQYIFSQFIHLLTKHGLQEHNIDFYADQMCISPQYLARIVQSVSHETLNTTISRVVIGQIESLLADTSLSMKQIADKSGFSDQAVLSKYYKRHTGKTPTEFRENLN